MHTHLNSNLETDTQINHMYSSFKMFKGITFSILSISRSLIDNHVCFISLIFQVCKSRFLSILTSHMGSSA